MQKYNLQKNPLKVTKYPSKYYNSIITNLKFQHKPKISSFKNPHIKNRPIIIIIIIIITRVTNSLKLLYYTL
jgi:hypothetical protein